MLNFNQERDNPQTTTIEDIQNQKSKILEFFKDSIDENKINFILEIEQLALKQNLTQFSTTEGFFQLCTKSIHELFLLKYELLVVSMSIIELLKNFQAISNLFKTIKFLS